jgi:hypothetical protein
MHRNGGPNPETARGLVATVAEIFFCDRICTRGRGQKNQLKQMVIGRYQMMSKAHVRQSLRPLFPLRFAVRYAPLTSLAMIL